MAFNAQTRIGDVVLELPAAMRVFEGLDMDYCCGGHKSLAEAAAVAGKPVETVLAALASLQAAVPAPTDPKLWTNTTMTALIDHLEATHHAFTRQELNRVAPLMERVLKVHGDHHPELLRLSQCLQTAIDDLMPHLAKEEQVLFPFIRGLESGTGAQACFGNVLGPIQVMQAEHEALGELLREMKTLTEDYTPPADACGSYRSLYMGLQSLEADLHLHIYLESHLLFPRAAEAATAQSRA